MGSRAKKGQDATGRHTGAQGAKKSAAEPKDAKGAKNATRAKTGAPKAKLSGLDAAAKALAETSEPLTCKQIVEKMLAKKLWTTAGKTPHATIYSAILREIQKKGDASRFRKVDRGKFTLAT